MSNLVDKEKLVSAIEVLPAETQKAIAGLVQGIISGLYDFSPAPSGQTGIVRKSIIQTLHVRGTCLGVPGGGKACINLHSCSFALGKGMLPCEQILEALAQTQMTLMHGDVVVRDFSTPSSIDRYKQLSGV
jgi:hypothetical protein